MAVVAAALALPLRDLAHLRRRVGALAEDRPAVYRMIDASGRVMYVGKAKHLRSRLLSYFRARYPEEKSARILQAATDIQWDYVPSEFAALLRELREIRRHRPTYNVRMNRTRRIGFIKVSGGPAPKVYVGRATDGQETRHYGPFSQLGRLREGIRVLNDLLRLRDCALGMSIAFAEQRDLFEPDRCAACVRHELGTCSGPCAGFVTETEYERQVWTAVDFLEGRAIAPLDHVIDSMAAAAEGQQYEIAARWRERFDALTWLLGACTRVQASLGALSFVYTDPGSHGDDRAYVILRGMVCAAAPAPHTPIERQAFRALVAEHSESDPEPGPIPTSVIDETLLVMSWFRRNPRAMKRTMPLNDWLTRSDRALR